MNDKPDEALLRALTDWRSEFSSSKEVMFTLACEKSGEIERLLIETNLLSPGFLTSPLVMIVLIAPNNFDSKRFLVNSLILS